MRPIHFLLLLPLAGAAHARRAAEICGAPARGRTSAFAVLERRAPSDTTATITVCLVSDETALRLAGYHGEITLGRPSRIVSVNRAAGGTRVENTTEPGRVSFAGVVADGLASGPLLSFTVARLAPADAARLRLTMLDVTDVGGRDVTARVRVDSLARLSQRRR
jgi:hypothetical protein